MQAPGPQLDQHIDREHKCYLRIALLSQRISANIFSHGCQMEIVLLCKTKDLMVKSMLDTGCSPGNYMSMTFYKNNVESLEEFLAPRSHRACGFGDFKFRPKHIPAPGHRGTSRGPSRSQLHHQATLWCPVWPLSSAMQSHSISWK